MHIEQIRIECELTQSTFGGGLNANCKWIGLTYVIILPSQSIRLISTRTYSMSYVRENKTLSTATAPARRMSENVAISISLKVIKRYHMPMASSRNVEETALIERL